jgi:uncharacterized protein
MLVPDTVDERARLAHEVSLRKHTSAMLSLIAAVSYRCNCACPECFQSALPKTVVMTEQTRAGIADLMAHVTDIRNPARAILWLTGGEPFVAPDVCADLAARCRATCASRRVPLTAATTTNGTLIRTARGRALAEQLDLFYVTLSESPAAQGAQRPFGDGRNTYAAVIDGLRILVELGKLVIVRFNIASGNAGCDHARLVIQDLYRAFGDVAYPRLSFEFSALICFQEKCASDPQTANEARTALRRLGPALNALATSTPWPRSAFRLRDVCALPGLHDHEHLEICDFLCGDGYYVSPSGDLYMCTTKANDPNYHLGRVDDSPRLFANDRFLRVLNLTPFDDPRCAACALLPACITECPLWRPGADHYATDTCVEEIERRAAEYVHHRDHHHAPAVHS